MKIHEYQAKRILKEFNVPSPKGYFAKSVKGSVKSAEKIGGNVWVVKAQIHAGGRGKAGGVKIAKSLSEVEKFASSMLGSTLVTLQTGAEGRKVKTILIEQGLNIEKEFYVGITLDRSVSKNVLMASTEGGVEIEKVASETPELIIKEIIEPSLGLREFQSRKVAFAMGLTGNQVKGASDFLMRLYEVYIKTDASIAEINPLVLTKEGEILALDAKINFDDNAIFRHPEIYKLRDFNEEEPLEIEASKNKLNYIKLDGNVGCMVNGAGLAMASMDIIKLSGGEPANFLDVGGGANKTTVANGFKIILSDPNVEAMLINIFGGIVRCDRVAQGIIDAINEVHINVPVVIRLEGTNAEEAKILLKNSGLNFSVASTLHDAAEKVTSIISSN
ncbi:MAG: ADP-forming succinate--CoA ligase subunit beta [Ignavibacteria bacterium]|nr:ADP-forming succinate--CoA ligase subunit beta [Ignavibacteria bacterium]